MNFYFISGLTLGIGVTQYISNKHFEIIENGLFKPHRQFFITKKNKLENDIALDETDYTKYIKNIIKSFSYSIYYITLGERREFLKMKQVTCYDLIENFESVKETIDNYDFIMNNLNQYEEDVIQETINQQKLLEEETKLKFKTMDDYNLENLQKIKEMAEGDYEQYLLDNSVFKKEEYLQNLTPEFRLQKEANRIRMLDEYYNTRDEFKREERGEDLQDKMKEYRRGTVELQNRKVAEEEAETIKKIEENQKLKVKTTVPLSKKYPTLKNVEKEIETLKNIFGEK